MIKPEVPPRLENLNYAHPKLQIPQNGNLLVLKPFCSGNTNWKCQNWRSFRLGNTPGYGPSFNLLTQWLKTDEGLLKSISYRLLILIITFKRPIQPRPCFKKIVLIDNTQLFDFFLNWNKNYEISFGIANLCKPSSPETYSRS